MIEDKRGELRPGPTEVVKNDPFADDLVDEQAKPMTPHKYEVVGRRPTQGGAKAPGGLK